MKFFFLTIMLAYLAGNVYLFVKFIKALQILTPIPGVYRIAFSLLFWIAAISLFVSIFAKDVNVPLWLSKFLYTLGSVWMVFTLYMVIMLLASDLLKLCIPVFKPILSQYGFLLSFGVVICILAYGYYNWRNPKINTVNISSNSISANKSLKIVAASDVHLGNGTGKKLLNKYIEMINAQKPDIILIAGDLIDNSVIPLYRENMAQELNRLEAPMGIYMVPGNHEYISGISKVEEFLKTTPIQLLKDSVVTLECGIRVIGRDDRFNRNRKSLEQLLTLSSETPTETSIESLSTRNNLSGHIHPTILLDHQPYELTKTDSLGITLQISGHTHRGQVWPLNWITDRLYEQSHGYRKWDNSHIYVSSGLSLWGPPFRIGTNSELVVINLL